MIFDDSLKTTSVSFFIADFSLLSCKFDSFTLNCCIVSFYVEKTKPLYDTTLTKLLQFLAKIQKQFLLLLQE